MKRKKETLPIALETNLDILILKHLQIYSKLYDWLMRTISPKKRYANSTRMYVINAALIHNRFLEEVLENGLPSFARILNETKDYGVLKEHAVIAPLIPFRAQLIKLFIKLRKQANEELLLFQYMREFAMAKSSTAQNLALFYSERGFEIAGYYLNEMEHSLLYIGDSGPSIGPGGDFSHTQLVLQIHAFANLLNNDFIMIDGYIRDPILLKLQNIIIGRAVDCQMKGYIIQKKYLI